jgi:hypothetical protein
MADKSGWGAFSSRTLCGLPESTTPWHPSGKPLKAFHGMISEYTFNSRTRRAINWVY